MKFFVNQAGGIVVVDDATGISVQLSRQSGRYVFVLSNVAENEALAYQTQFERLELPELDFTGLPVTEAQLVYILNSVQQLEALITSQSEQ